MFLAFDAHYREDHSKLVAAVFENWTDAEALEIRQWHFGPAADYEPGQFYLREMPLLLQALEDFHREEINAILVDGYVYLDANERLGLGGHLFQALDEKIPIIGVAKSYFRNTNAELVLRGQSKKPLYVTAYGISPAAAADHIRSMAGSYRMPAILGAVDQETKVGSSG